MPTYRYSNRLSACGAILFALLLGACASRQSASQESITNGVQTFQEKRILGFLTPYRPDIQQGNFVTQEMMAQLKTGMTKEQVRFVLGTPLLMDVFHTDRWDYVFRLQRGNGEVTSSRVTVFFGNDRLMRIDGGNLPTEEDYLDHITGKTSTAKRSTN